MAGLLQAKCEAEMVVLAHLARAHALNEEADWDSGQPRAPAEVECSGQSSSH